MCRLTKHLLFMKHPKFKKSWQYNLKCVSWHIKMHIKHLKQTHTVNRNSQNQSLFVKVLGIWPAVHDCWWTRRMKKRSFNQTWSWSVEVQASGLVSLHTMHAGRCSPVHLQTEATHTAFSASPATLPYTTACMISNALRAGIRTSQWWGKQKTAAHGDISCVSVRTNNNKKVALKIVMYSESTFGCQFTF